MFTGSTTCSFGLRSSDTRCFMLHLCANQQAPQSVRNDLKLNLSGQMLDLTGNLGVLVLRNNKLATTLVPKLQAANKQNANKHGYKEPGFNGTSACRFRVASFRPQSPKKWLALFHQAVGNGSPAFGSVCPLWDTSTVLRNGRSLPHLEERVARKPRTCPLTRFVRGHGAICRSK